MTATKEESIRSVNSDGQRGYPISYLKRLSFVYYAAYLCVCICLHCRAMPRPARCPDQGTNSIYRCHFTSIANPIVGIRRSYDRFISTTGFPKLVKWHLYIESRPRTPVLVFASLSQWQLRDLTIYELIQCVHNSKRNTSRHRSQVAGRYSCLTGAWQGSLFRSQVQFGQGRPVAARGILTPARLLYSHGLSDCSSTQNNGM